MASQSKAKMTPSPKTAPGSTISKNATVRATPGKSADGDRKEQAPRTAVTTPVGTVVARFHDIALSDASSPSKVEHDDKNQLRDEAKPAPLPKNASSAAKNGVSTKNSPARPKKEDSGLREDPKTPTSAPSEVAVAADTNEQRSPLYVPEFMHGRDHRVGEDALHELDRPENIPEGYIVGYHNFHRNDCKHGKKCAWLKRASCLFRHEPQDVAQYAPPGTKHVNGWLARSPIFDEE